MICEGSGFPEGDSANAPDFITGRFHDPLFDTNIRFSLHPLLRMISAYIGGAGRAAVVRTTKCPSLSHDPAHPPHRLSHKDADAVEQ